MASKNARRKAKRAKAKASAKAARRAPNPLSYLAVAGGSKGGKSRG